MSSATRDPGPDPRIAEHWQELEDAASRAARRASRLSPPPPRGGRGAALLSRSGRVYSGPELGGPEGLAASAERIAVQSAVLSGQRRFVAVLLRSGPRGTGDAGPPDSASLQVLAEFSPRARVYWGTPSHLCGGREVRDLLPGAFGAGHLPPGT